MINSFYFGGRTRTCEPEPHEYLAFLAHDFDEEFRGLHHGDQNLQSVSFNSRNVEYKVSGAKYRLSSLMGYIVENVSLR